LGSPKYWLIVERYENWLADKANEFSYYGLHRTKLKLASKVSKGDKLITYVSSGLSSFADLREVIEDDLIDIHQQNQYDDIYQYALRTKSILLLEEASWVPIKDHLQSLSFTKGKKNWGMVMYNPLRQMNEEDALFLIQKMQEAHRNTVSFTNMVQIKK